MSSRSLAFTAVRTEGGLLPADLLGRIASLEKVDGLSGAAYHLLPHEKLNEAINRSWTRLLGAWAAFERATSDLPPGEAGTTPTRERWLLVLFSELGYGRLQATSAFELEGRSYPISHAYGSVPIHLVGRGVSVDRRAKGIAGAAGASPYSLLQEFLNRSEDHLWGIVSNGLVLRVLRDNKSLTRQAFIEFDLATMMNGEQYADFALLWLLCHQSRFEGERPDLCWLEKWSKLARDQGIRLLDRLRDGVERAIACLGRGFLAHPANGALRERLRSGALDRQDYYRQVLRLIYRLIFLLVAEERGLLLLPGAPEAARTRYERFYSVARLRRLAERRGGTAHGDLYAGLRLVMAMLAETGCPDLGLPALGSFLWAEAAVPDLAGADLTNRELLGAIRALSYTEDGKVRRTVDYRNLDSDELGSVYEALLELHPDIDAEAGKFELVSASGSERKQTGSYYTPSSLVNCLLDSALDPVLDEASRKPNPEKAILTLKVCDPACGSGHFLIAAAHRMAKRLAAVRTGNDEPDPDSVRKALRDVVSHCIYGVDLNEMAAELCKVTLWLEALDPGRPLSFLDHRIQVGNSLLGATPALMAKGIPDEAFTPIEGDDRGYCSELKEENRRRMPGLYDQLGVADCSLNDLAAGAEQIDALSDATVDGVSRKAAAWQQFSASESLSRERLAAYAWCAAFVWRKTRDLPMAVTHGRFRQLQEDPAKLPEWLLAEIRRLADQYRFFHWHLAFPDVFSPFRGADNPDTGWAGGFDVMLGNPPWERVKLQEKEWFAARHPGIASAPNAARREAMIRELQQSDPALLGAFLEARRTSEGESHFVRDSGRFPLCGRGDVNTYAIFAETFRSLLATDGRAGFIVPTGIATDDTTKEFFRDLVTSGTLHRLLDFQSGPGLFGAIGHARFKFCLLTVSGSARAAPTIDLLFFARSLDDLLDPDRQFSLAPGDFSSLNPNTGTCPIFRTRRDAEITKGVYRCVPVLINDGPPKVNSWGVDVRTRLWHMAEDSAFFRTISDLEAAGFGLAGNVFVCGERYVPLYEAKMLHQFDHRFGDYRDKPADSESTALPEIAVSRLAASDYLVLPRYWVPDTEVEDRLVKRDKGGKVTWKWDRSWLLGWRDICRSTDERTVVAAVLPRTAVNHTFPLMFPECRPEEVACLLGILNSLMFDFIARQKLGGTHLTIFILKQLPVPAPSFLTQQVPWATEKRLLDWLVPRVLELTYTASDLAPWAADLGYLGPPFRWVPDRRFLIRAELDAAFFHLYGVGADDVDYILDTFPIVRRHDEGRFGEYRTKRIILEIYEEMARAIATGQPYETRLGPPPADPAVAHAPRPEPAGLPGSQ